MVVSGRKLGLLAAVGLLLLALLVAACEDKSATSDTNPPSSLPTPTSSTKATQTSTAMTIPQSEPSTPLVSRWPPGVTALVVRQSDGYAVVDENGVRFKLANPDQSTERGPSGQYANRKAADIVPSNNGKYLAYRFGGGDLVVFALDTGVILGTMETRFTDDVAAVSDDGRWVVLVDEGTGPGIVSTAPAGPFQRVSIADVTTGEISVPGTIAELVPADGGRDDPFLNGVAWLSDQSVFLLKADSRPISTIHSQDVYLYNPTTDELTRADGLMGLWGPVSTGGFVGYTRQLEAAMGPTSTAPDLGPVVWQQGKATGFAADLMFSAGVGAVSPDGSAVIMVEAGKEAGSAARGWQLFQRGGDGWRPLSQVWLTPEGSNLTYPTALSGDNRTAWGFDHEEIPSDPTRQHLYLVSLDTRTGVWTDWFRLRDLLVDPNDFRIGHVVFD